MEKIRALGVRLITRKMVPLLHDRLMVTSSQF